MKDPRRFGSSRAEPNIILAVRDETGAAGRESAFVGQGRRQVGPGKRSPIRAAILGDYQLKLSLDGIAQGNAVLVVPEGKRIKEAIAVGIFELKAPRFAAILSFVNLGFIARPGAQEVGPPFIESFDIAKVELFRAGHSPDGPGLARVGRSSIDPFRAADPCNLRTNNAKPAQVRIRKEGLLYPLGVSDGIAKHKKKHGEAEVFHRGFPYAEPRPLGSGFRHRSLTVAALPGTNFTVSCP